MGWVVALLIGSAVVWMLARAGSDQGRRKAMVVNGFELPAAFVQLYEAIQPGTRGVGGHRRSPRWR
jgi:hypothetical protein